MRHPDPRKSIESYRGLAPVYDRSCRRMMPVREKVIALLRLRPGDTVLDVASGTGLSFGYLVAAVGPAGRVIAIEHSPDMMEIGRERVRSHGWENVILLEGDAAEAAIPGPVDAVLFHFTHDVLQSQQALENIFSVTRLGARIGVAGAKFGSWWLAPLNFWAMFRARKYLTTFAHLDAPWHLLAQYVPALAIEPRLFGTAYVAHGTYAKGNSVRPAPAMSIGQGDVD